MFDVAFIIGMVAGISALVFFWLALTDTDDGRSR